MAAGAPPPTSRASSVRDSSGGRGSSRRQPISTTGTWRRRPPSVPRVRRLDGSAHCRSSTATTSGWWRASDSTRSPKASTAWNCRPGSLLTVTGPPSPRWVASRAATARRRASGDEPEHASVLARTPNGRVRSSSWARPLTTSSPRARASPKASASSRVLPRPASPSTSTIAGWPKATRSNASPSASSSTSRPRSRGLGASVAIGPCYRPPGPARGPPRVVATGGADRLP